MKNVAVWFAVSWVFLHIGRKNVTTKEALLGNSRHSTEVQSTEVNEFKAAAEEAVQNSAQAEVVEAASEALADFLGTEVAGPLGPLFRIIGLFLTDIALDLKEEELARREADKDASEFERFWRRESRANPAAEAFANAARQTTNVVVARNAVDQLSAMSTFRDLFDASVVTKILIKSIAKVEESLAESEPEVWWEKYQEAVGRDRGQMLKHKLFFEK